MLPFQGFGTSRSSAAFSQAFSRAPLTVFVLTALLVVGCDGPFPVADKIGPSDKHNVNRGGALHKEGLDHPLTESAGCSDSDCHQTDLRGGLALVDDVVRVAPSCYQCHGKKWDDDADDERPAQSVEAAHSVRFTPTAPAPTHNRTIDLPFNIGGEK